jgi:hypothetical protein
MSEAKFDLSALHRALDQRRRVHGMSWQQVADEMAGSIGGHGHRISATTITRTALGGTMEADGVLAMVTWLGLSCNDFVRDARIPPPSRRWDSHSVRRFDARAFFSAVEEKRAANGKTWAQLSSEIRGFTPGMLTRLSKGGRMSIQQVVALSAWLGVAPEDFAFPRSPA